MGASVLWSLLGGACADLERGAAPVPPDASASDAGTTLAGQAPTFASVRPLLVTDCATCHAAERQAGRTSLLLGADVAADYRSVRGLVDTNNPAASRLLAKAGGQGHEGGTLWGPTSTQRALVTAWVAGGALR